MVNYGFIASKMDGTELEFKSIDGLKIPNEYSYQKFLSPVINQGNKPICVPCSVSAYINWEMNLDDGNNNKDNNVIVNEIFDARDKEAGDDGMSFKDALHFLRHSGVTTDDGKYKIDRYAKVGSDICLKQALVANGPCIGGLPVYNSSRCDFWNKLNGDSLEGFHAVSIIGYNKIGFILRNSWGKGFGNNGYVTIPYDCFDKFSEIWTII